ncbi:MAG: VWA domain-containing protein [Candidatus Sulfotelmatobacter sp.]
MLLPIARLRPWVAIFVLASPGFACPGFAQAAPEHALESIYRTGANEVQLTFSATDENNHGMATLQASDFAVVDKERVVRNFRSFHRVDFTRLDVAVLIDSSESVASSYRQETASTLRLISQMDGIPAGSFSVVSFHGAEPAILCAGKCRAFPLAEQLAGVHAGGLTPLFDGVVFASDFLSRSQPSNGEGSRASDFRVRRVLIIFSDGDDTISVHSAADAMKAALENDVQVYAVDTGEPTHPGAGSAFLRTLAQVTGGRSLAMKQGAVALVGAILEDFHATYTVSYQLPSRVPGFHPVRILPASNSHLQFRCRSGYYYPGNTSPDAFGN